MVQVSDFWNEHGIGQDRSTNSRMPSSLGALCSGPFRSAEALRFASQSAATKPPPITPACPRHHYRRDQARAPDAYFAGFRVTPCTKKFRSYAPSLYMSFKNAIDTLCAPALAPGTLTT